MLTEFDMPMEYQILLGAIRYEWGHCKDVEGGFPEIQKVRGVSIRTASVDVWQRECSEWPDPLAGVHLYFGSFIWLHMCLGDYTEFNGNRIIIGGWPQYKARKVNPKKIVKAIRLLF